MKIRVWAKTNRVGSMNEDEFEMDDDSSDDEIEDAAREMMWELIEWSWERIDDTEDDE